jgi:hypothetical protein
VAGAEEEAAAFSLKVSPLAVAQYNGHSVRVVVAEAAFWDSSAKS